MGVERKRKRERERDKSCYCFFYFTLGRIFNVLYIEHGNVSCEGDSIALDGCVIFCLLL